MHTRLCHMTYSNLHAKVIPRSLCVVMLQPRKSSVFRRLSSKNLVDHWLRLQHSNSIHAVKYMYWCGGNVTPAACRAYVGFYNPLTYQALKAHICFMSHMHSPWEAAVLQYFVTCPARDRPLTWHYKRLLHCQKHNHMTNTDSTQL